MPKDNVSPNGEGVKSPTRRFAPKGAVTGSRQREPAANLDDARQAKRDAQEKEWIHQHGWDDRKNKPKPPSLECIYARHMTSGKTGKWACQAGDAAGAVIHKWNNTYWQAINNEVGGVMASDWLEHHSSHAANANKSQKCWDYAAMRLRRLNPLPKLDCKRAIVPCADAYIEVLKNGFQVLAADPALGMTHAVKIASGGKVGRPYFRQVLTADSMFAKFLARAQPDPAVRALLQEQCGMTLLPGNYSQAAWWYGAAGSGKSTLAELVEAMHRQSVRLNLETLGDRFSLEPLVGASLILVDEVECEKWAEGRFKTLVSGNGIGIDRKNEKALASYHSRAKWLITSNSAPFVRDKSDGVWRRLVVVNWSVVVPEKERQSDFHQILLEKEGKMILDWMLEGARRIVERGHTLPDHELPEEARKAKQRARNNCDSVRAWAHEMRVCYASEQWTPLGEVYKHYEAWCSTQGFLMNEMLTPRQFWRGMAEAGLVKPDRKANRRVDGKQTDFYELKILGTATELVSNWAVAEQVTTSSDQLKSVDQIFDAYKLWAGGLVEDEALDPMNLLGAGEFWMAMTQAGYINPLWKASQTMDGKVVDCYPLAIMGKRPFVEPPSEGEGEPEGATTQ